MNQAAPSNEKSLKAKAKTEAKLAARGISRAVSSQATEIAESLKREARLKKSEVANEIKDAGKAVRTVSESIEQNKISGALEQLSDSICTAADRLDETHFSEVYDLTEDFARKQPLVFALGSFTLGLLATRFAKSQPRRVRKPLLLPAASSKSESFQNACDKEVSSRG